ncbi:MAG: SUMF1/EgtB/PvdO family nonheme iron enzyme [Bacteroidales bacterium]|nr:SUMF1/EgtB/PvdO family nonheme iron enzyme [Bacteroidales bacterium]
MLISKCKELISEFENKSIFYATLRAILRNMVFVSEGRLLIFGDAGKISKEETVNNFYICKYPVTQKEWVVFSGDNPSGFKGDDLPVENVSWIRCNEFCIKLASITALKFSLPTVNQWQFAAYGGNNSKRFTYSGSNDINEVAWISANSSSTKPVGLKKPNELGLYDMSGNVWEWCLDDVGYQKARIGGNWSISKFLCVPSFVSEYSKSSFNCDLGFRLVINC